MKGFTVLLVLGFAALTHQQGFDLKKMMADRNACLTETGAKLEDVKRGFREGIFAEDPNLKCFYKCVSQKEGILTASGTFDVNVLKSRIPPFLDRAKAEAAIEKCKDTATSSDLCQVAFDYSKCFHANVGPINIPDTV